MPAIYRRLPQLTRGDALANAISILEVLQATSSVIANAPFVGSIVGAALGLAKTVERVNGTRERYVRLARRAAELARHIEESIKSDPYLIDHNLQIQLVALHDLLIRIQRDVEKHLRRRPLSRLLYQSSMAATLDDYVDALDSAWRTFDTACLFALRMKMERQAIYDDQSQLRLFRWSDLRCLKVRGKYRVSCYDVGEEWEGKWDGRTVIVRTIRQSRPSEGCDYTSLVKYHPNLHHPYVAQVIGYSHPSLAERFYVMDAGVSPLMNQFRGKDIFSRLVMWLQHVVDYQVNAYLLSSDL
ncbi:hypothetical protein C8Q74DRAFT_595226 [Fomes fomentarius]|nr:hypothetical protein C8Q74DRAFT_595226 [Fomes fomentarius]